MRVLMLSIDNYSTDVLGPQAIRMLTLAQSLAEWAEVTLVTTTPLKKEHVPEGVKTVFVPGYVGVQEIRAPHQGLMNIMRLYAGLRGLLKDYDVFYTDATYYPYLGRTANRCVIEVNGILGLELSLKSYIPFHGAIARFGRFLEKLTLGGADEVIAVTKGLRRYLIKNYGLNPNRIHAIPNGVDIERFKKADMSVVQELKERYGLTDNVTFIFVGSFRPWHDVFAIIRAFSRVIKKVPYGRLIMVGDGPMKSEAMKLACDVCPKGSVVFTGSVPPERVADYMAIADIGLHYAALTERLKLIGECPLKIGEYMAAGLAVIAGPLPYVAEEEAEKGAVYGVRSEGELYHAMCDLATHRDKREELQSAAKGFVLRNLSMSVVGEHIYRMISGGSLT